MEREQINNVQCAEWKREHYTHYDYDNNDDYQVTYYECSVCGRKQSYGNTKFCPNCGAKMKEGLKNG